MASMVELISYDNAVFRAYAFWTAVLIAKMLFMSVLTGFQRFRTQTFANQEDLQSSKQKVKFDEPNVERVRRAHRNDLENVLPFILIGMLYVLTNPDAFMAINIIRAGAIARIVHTVVYAVVVIPQPARALAFFVCLGATVFMAMKCIVFFL